MTAGVVSCMLGGWFLWVWLFWHLLLILRKFLFPAGGWSASGFLLGVRVRGPRTFGFFYRRQNKYVKCIHG